MIRRFIRRMRGLPEVPHIVVPMGLGVIGIGAGTFADKPALALIPSLTGKVGKMGEEMELKRDADGRLIEIPPGAIIITFETVDSLMNVRRSTIDVLGIFNDRRRDEA